MLLSIRLWLLSIIFQHFVHATNQQNLQLLEELLVSATIRNKRGTTDDYIAAASAFNVNQTNPSELQGIPPSGILNYELHGQDALAEAQIGSMFNINCGYARYLQGQNVEIGTCEIPNSKYDDWVAFLSPDVIVPTADASLCEEGYCVQVIYGTRAVNLQVNGAALETSYYDVALSRKAFDVLTIPNLQVIRVTWSLVDCQNHPLGPTFID